MQIKVFTIEYVLTNWWYTGPSIFLGGAGMYWSCTYPHSVSNSVIIIRRLVFGLPERASLSTEGRPYSKLCCHSLSLLHGIVGKGLQNLLGVLSFSIIKLLSDTDTISLFVHLAEKQFDECTLHVWPPSVIAGSWRGLKISKHAQEVGVTSHSKDFVHQPLAGKIKSYNF